MTGSQAESCERPDENAKSGGKLVSERQKVNFGRVCDGFVRPKQKLVGNCLREEIPQ